MGHFKVKRFKILFPIIFFILLSTTALITPKVVIPAKAGIQVKDTGCAPSPRSLRLPSVARVKPGMTRCTGLVSSHIEAGFSPLRSTPENMKPAAKEGEEILSRAEKVEGIQEKIYLTVESEKEEVFTNEVSLLKIKLFATGFPTQDIQYPKFSHPGFSATQFNPPLQKKEVVKGVLFDTWEFQTEIIGQRPGDYILGPAELSCLLQTPKGERENPTSEDGKKTSEDYFGRYETLPLNLRSEKIKIRVMPFPAKGKPKNFNGAVGDFHFTVDVHPKEVTAGGPLTLKITIGGKGNFSSITVPTLEKPDDFKIYKAQVMLKDGVKIFEQVLLPQREVKEVPGVSFSFFDPNKRAYRTLYQEPLTIKMVNSGPSDQQGERETLGRDIIYIKDSPGHLKKKGEFLYKNRAFLLTQFLTFLLFISLFFLSRRREKMRTDLRYAGQRRASKNARKGIKEADRILREGKSKEFYDILFKTLQTYVGQKFQISSAGITGETADQDLRSKGIEKDLRGDLKAIFEECDKARYGLSSFERTNMERTLQMMKQTISRVERKRP